MAIRGRKEWVAMSVQVEKKIIRVIILDNIETECGIREEAEI